MQSAVSVTTLKGLSQTNSLESIITLVQSALAQFLITRGGSGFSQVNACCTWGQHKGAGLAVLAPDSGLQIGSTINSALNTAS